MTTTTTNWIILAHLLRPQGRRGELLAEIRTDFPESFSNRKELFLTLPQGSPDARREVILESHWLHKGRVVLKFAGIDTINDADTLRGYDVTIPREQRIPLEEEAVYISDLLGVQVVDVSGGGRTELGRVLGVQPGGVAPDLLVVGSASTEPLLIPFAKAYLRKLDLAAKTIEMELPAGLTTMQDPITEEERRQMQSEAAQESPQEPSKGT